jgi:hypothetical protein
VPDIESPRADIALGSELLRAQDESQSLPMRNRLGPVPDAFAEEAILDAGQVVGTQTQEELRAKDPEEMLPAESICLAFRQRLMAKLKTVIPGIRVENFPTRQ